MIDIKDNPLFKRYSEILIEENKKYNLTTITEIDEIYVKHFIDSLKLTDIIDVNNKHLCDIGSGAGFPGIPLKIMNPSMKLTLVEATKKRCNFLEKVVRELKLENVEIINERAENIKNKKYDIVTARAVSKLRMLIELCIPIVKEGKYFIALKSKNFQEEIDESKRTIKLLGCEIEKIMEYNLETYGKRALIKIKKIKPTDSKYPRRYALIKNKPL